jgi:repressor LexA
MAASRIRFLRKKFGLSQAQLASQLNVTQQAVGKWETGKSFPDTSALVAMADFFETSVDYLIGKENVFYEIKVSETKGYQIPILGTVKAGYNAYAYSEDLGTEYASVSNPDEYFFLTVRGDSMEPRIKDGDLALVHKQNYLENGDLGVIIYDGDEGTLKKFVRRGNMVILQPFNPDYEAKILQGEDLNNIYIAGKVVETKTKW